MQRAPRGFLGVPDVDGLVARALVVDELAEGAVVEAAGVDASPTMGIPPRSGRARWTTASRPTPQASRVCVGSERCLPAKARRRSEGGSERRRERSSVREEISSAGGTVSVNATDMSASQVDKE